MTNPDPNAEPAPSIYRQLGGAPIQSPAPAGGGLPPEAAAPSVATPVLQPGQRHYVLADWGPRVGAYLIDAILFGVLGYTLYLVMAVAGGLTINEATLFFAIPLQPETVADSTWLYVARALGALIPMGATAVALAVTNGRTPGKQVLGIRVVTLSGRRLGWKTAMVRQLLLQGIVLSMLSWITLGLAWILNYLWPLWDAQHRTGHDRFASTRVVRELPSAPPADSDA